MGPLSDDDLDAMTRTVLSEASPDPHEQAAVAHVILNRTMSGSAGGYADTIPGVLSQPHQFAAPSTIDPGSPAYARTRQIVEDAVNGHLPDETGGYTHFLAPKAMGNKPWPAWAPREGGVQIGATRFYPQPHSMKAAAEDGDVTNKLMTYGVAPSDTVDPADDAATTAKLMGYGQAGDVQAPMAPNERVAEGFAALPPDVPKGDTDYWTRLKSLVQQHPYIAAAGAIPLGAMLAPEGGAVGGGAALATLIRLAIQGGAMGVGFRGAEDLGLIPRLLTGGSGGEAVH
jgi:hypothetical protein